MSLFQQKKGTLSSYQEVQQSFLSETITADEAKAMLQLIYFLDYPENSLDDTFRFFGKKLEGINDEVSSFVDYCEEVSWEKFLEMLGLCNIEQILEVGELPPKGS